MHTGEIQVDNKRIQYFFEPSQPQAHEEPGLAAQAYLNGYFILSETLRIISMNTSKKEYEKAIKILKKELVRIGAIKEDSLDSVDFESFEQWRKA